VRFDFVSYPVSDGHIELSEIQFWGDDSDRYRYLVNYVENGEERALLHDSEESEVVYGIRQRGTGIYCEIARKSVESNREFI
jgi:hypothetical protein